MRTKRYYLNTLFICLLLINLLKGIDVSPVRAQGRVTSPESFFGFKLGSDKKIARWDKIVQYFERLEKESDKIKVINMGPSTMGHPFLVLFISSPENLSNLDRLQKINATISDPRGVDEKEIKKLIKEGKTVICQSMSLHATEIGGTQMAPELAYDLITQQDDATRRILDNVLFIMIPCFNPDGQIMVTDWYNQSLGKPHEGISLPWLYHKYVGHDNNRDGDFLSMIESQYTAKIMYMDWIPQAYLDHHHMGSYGARFYVPPYCEPIRPYADPLIWREISWYGAHIAYKLEEAGKKGILNAAQFPGWGHFGWHWITPFHNIAGMLTESANAKLATPLYIHPEQLKGGSRQFPEYAAQSTFPSPWSGGWWRLLDIVEQKKISAMALLDLAAKNKETALWNAYLKARHQTERGAEGSPNGVVIPTDQHDQLTTVKMINILLQSGIEIQKAQKDFIINGKIYKADTYYIPFAQPKMGLIHNLLVKTQYADNDWTRGKDGAPLRPYDLSTHTMHEFMGVRVDPIDGTPKGDLVLLIQPEPLIGEVVPGINGHVLDGRLNDSYKAVNLLLNTGMEIKRVTRPEGLCHPGDFIVLKGSEKILAKVAEETGVTMNALAEALPGNAVRSLKRNRVSMYQRYYGGNMDEGWTRFLLEQFAFPYQSIMDNDLEEGELNGRFDLIILPSDSPELMTGEIPERFKQWIPAEYPEKYKSGINDDGIENLKTFVREGGTVVALAEACAFAIEKFELTVRNSIDGLTSTEFFCPGSTLRVTFDHTNPLAYGMPEEGFVLFQNSPAFEIVPGHHNEKFNTVVRYRDEDLLQSGWLIGEKKLAKKAGMLSAEYGEGHVILIGFRTQHRYQTHGTFKLLFNTIFQTR